MVPSVISVKRRLTRLEPMNPAPPVTRNTVSLGNFRWEYISMIYYLCCLSCVFYDFALSVTVL